MDQTKYYILLVYWYVFGEKW